jgi:hypothetical protein
MTNIPESETALPETFDPTTQEGSKFDVVPVAVYKAQITDASVSQPQSGDGWGINLSWQITEGEYEGRYVFQRITFIHSSIQATTIGRRQFKDLCVATGIDEQVTDVAVFKFIPCQIRVGIEQDKQGVYPDKNRVSRILPFDAPVKPVAKTAKTAKPAQPTASAPSSTTTAAATTASATAATTPATKAANEAAGNLAGDPSGANGNVPPWRKAKPSPSEELDDKISY